MKLELEVYTALCEPKVFRINDIRASKLQAIEKEAFLWSLCTVCIRRLE
jgi:hypothetical protein